MAGTHGKPMFINYLNLRISPPPGWKCPKRFKLGLGEPCESEGSDDSDTEKVEVHMEETTKIHKNATMKTIRSDITEIKRQETNYNSKAETNKLLLLASQGFEASLT